MVINKRLPAEWENQFATLLTWPHAGGAWGQDTRNIEQVFIAITRAVVISQTIIIAAFDEAHQAHIMGVLRNAEIPLMDVLTYIAPSNDVWARDHGPITVFADNQPVLCDFQFNGWGGKYAHQLDEQIPKRLTASGLLSKYAYQPIPFILEGGAIACDGQGTLLTTEQCLRSKGRHAHLSHSAIEEHLAEYLGIKRVLWLKEGYLAGDDTDGHIDTLARFLSPDTIAYVGTNDPSDPHFATLKAMEKNLQTFKTTLNQPYRLIKLPLPAAQFDHAGRPLPATYANFLFCNQQILVPTYQDPQDQLVLEIFREHFPNKTIVGIDCRSAIEQYGSLHCLTMQIPALV